MQPARVPDMLQGTQENPSNSRSPADPLEEALSGNSTVKRISRCQKHIGMEIDSYCRTCEEAIFARCGIEKHSGHIFCPLSQVTGPLQDQIAGYSIITAKREEKARKGLSTFDETIHKIGEHRRAAEKETAELFDAVVACVEERRVQVLQHIQDKEDQLRKTVMKDKGEAESGIFELEKFRTFTEGLLAQGTPLEIAGTHKMVRLDPLSFSLSEILSLTSFSLLGFYVVTDTDPSQK